MLEGILLVVAVLLFLIWQDMPKKRSGDDFPSIDECIGMNPAERKKLHRRELRGYAKGVLGAVAILGVIAYFVI